MTEEVWIVRVLLRLTSFSKKLWLYRKSLDDSGLKQIKHYRKTLWLLLDEHCTTELKQNSCIHFCIKRLSGRALSFECCIKSKKCVKKLKPRLWPDKCLQFPLWIFHICRPVYLLRSTCIHFEATFTSHVCMQREFNITKMYSTRHKLYDKLTP